MSYDRSRAAVITLGDVVGIEASRVEPLLERVGLPGVAERTSEPDTA